VNTANRVVVTTTSGAKTRALGRRLARLLRAGDILLLQGPLGAGKTTLAQGIGAGLRVDAPVRSPTFVLMARHDGGALPLYHADLYRLESADEVADLSLAEQASDGVLLVEWPERGLAALPEEHVLVVLEPAPDEASTRRITVVAVGDRYKRVLDGLLAAGLADRV
jgi:tRNA threonylcarbamoyladenosine biosynthesis protein TsaE